MEEEPLDYLAAAAGAFFECRVIVVVVLRVVSVGREGRLGRGRVWRAQLTVPVVVRVHTQRARCQLDGWSGDRSHSHHDYTPCNKTNIHICKTIKGNVVTVAFGYS